MKWFVWSCLLLSLTGVAWAVDPVTYNAHAFSTNDPIDSVAAETVFLDAVTTGGFSTFTEDFEAPAWNTTRSPSFAANIVNHGIDWHSSAGNHITTLGDSDSFEDPPPFMIWAHNHPVPNTLIGESTTRLYGIGFWADGTGTKGKIKVILDDAVEVKFQRIIGYTQVPPDPPEPEKETVRLDYSKEFFGVYAPDGFNKFQLLEFAGEFDEVVLMWMRTFTFAYLPAARTEDIRITGIDSSAGNLQIRFTATPAHSNFILQTNGNLPDPVGWVDVTNSPVIVSQNLYQVTTTLPPETNSMFRIISNP